MMGKGSKNSAVSSHQTLKCQAKNRVQHLQFMLNELQSARKDSRTDDVASLVEQVDGVLREWKTELDEPSPASSFIEESLGSFEQFSSLLKYFDIEDDATSPLTVPPIMMHGNGNEHGNLHVTNEIGVSNCAGDTEAYNLKHASQHHYCQRLPDHVASHVPQQHDLNNLGTNHQLDFDFDSEIYLSPNDIGQWGAGDLPDFSDVLPNVNPQPSAFLGPKCALWDCVRPAEGSEIGNNYCNSFHAKLARNECPPGTGPVLRPGGIDLKDGPLILALKSKIEGKDVGIPESPGAASTKSPWNAPELFDISLLEGENIREWLFFDKPRRAFETGNRKQRSLPDHEGRGWHESRKLPLNDYGGRKRSYYADPQPQKHLDWHLFEYEVDNIDSYALYRLELKVVAEKKSPKLKGSEEKKKSPKTKVTNDPLLDLQKQMGRLTAVVSTLDKHSGKGKANAQFEVGNVMGSSSPS